MTRMISVGVGLLASLHLFSAPIDQWFRRNPSHDWSTLSSIAYGNGRLVAVGEDGTLAVSTNGVDWQTYPRVIFQTAQQMQIAFGNGRFVLVNGVGYYTSTNGIQWQQRYADVTHIRTHVVFCAGQFMAMGSGDDVLTSPDGVTWTRTLLPVPSGSYLSSAASDQGTTIVVGSGGVVVRTTNGVDWALVPSFTNSFEVAIFDGTAFHIAGFNGALYSSTNGLNWVDRRLPNFSFPAIATFNGRTVLGGTTFAAIKDGFVNYVWPIPIGGYDVTGITVTDGGVFWAVSYSGGDIRRSTNGIDWTDVTTHIAGLSPYQHLRGVGFDGRKFIAAGDSECVTSTNGSTWTRMTTQPNLTTVDITYANGRWVAVGGDTSDPQSELIASSTNGTNWVLHSAPGLSNQFLYRVQYVGGRFIAVGDGGRIVVSTNGTNWVLRQVTPPTALKCVAYGRGTFIAGGDTNIVFTSTDAITWTGHVINQAYNFKDITFGRGRFVAVVDTILYDHGDQQIWSSFDGLNWRAHAGYAQRVFYEDGVFVAAGDGRIATSFDGENFTLRSLMVGNDPLGICFGRRTFVVVGANGLIMQSAVLPPHIFVSVLRDDAALGPIIEVDTPGEGDHDFQCSPDMESWTTFATLSGTNEVLRLRHTNPPAGPTYYRAVLR